MNTIGRIITTIALAATSAAPAPAGGPPAPGQWTYDGRLEHRGAPVSGVVDLAFRFFAAPADGDEVGPALFADAVAVEDGSFSVVLEFGDFAFDAARHWVEMSVDGRAVLPRRRLVPTYELDEGGAVTADPSSAIEPEDPAAPPGSFGAAPRPRDSVPSGFEGAWDPGDPGDDDETELDPLTAEENDDGEGDPGDAGGGVWDTRGSEYYYKRANVGVGTSNPAYPLDVRTSSKSRALNVDNTRSSGSRYAIYARARSTTGRGVYGYASASSGATIGVYGRSDSADGAGLYGLASAGTGTPSGVYGRSSSLNGRGVYGEATATAGASGYGVHGRSESANGRGVYGIATDIDGVNYGVFGRSESDTGFGLYGVANRLVGAGTGCYAKSRGSTGVGGQFVTDNGGRALVAVNELNANDIIQAWQAVDLKFRALADGNVRCDGAFTGGGADFAEWVAKERAADAFEAGEIVGVSGGRVTRRTSGAHRLAVISTAPAFIGNGGGAELDDRPDHALVAFVGRTPVKVRGPVAAGDFIVPSGRGDGVGTAVSAQVMTSERLREVVGMAWESARGEGEHVVTISVGMEPLAASVIVIERLQQRLEDMDARLAALEAGLERPVIDAARLVR